MRLPLHLLALALTAATAHAQPAPLDAAAALAGTQGEWAGELQYRDYQSDTWQGLPMTVAIVAQPDGVTTVRTAQFDDGPQTGIVTITTIAQVDSATATIGSAMFRKGRAIETTSDQISSFTAGADAAHWTLVTSDTRRDGDGSAMIRETTTRDGDSMTTLKEVNPEGDGVDQWLPRNRTVLTRRVAD